jgi:hypothetical protein
VHLIPLRVGIRGKKMQRKERFRCVRGGRQGGGVRIDDRKARHEIEVSLYQSIKQAEGHPYTHAAMTGQSRRGTMIMCAFWQILKNSGGDAKQQWR